MSDDSQLILCPVCEGNGECCTCCGTGEVYAMRGFDGDIDIFPLRYNEPSAQALKCSNCDGTGECSECHGTGKVQ